MTVPFFEPTEPVGSRKDVFVRYLGYFRESVLAKAAALPGNESILPSGWTAPELVKHLRWVEYRWIEWGFEGRPTVDPWGDREGGRWHADEPFQELAAQLRRQGAHTEAVVAGHDLDERGQPGERWDGAEPATLERVLFHLLQEYARHLGHLDVVAELSGAGRGSPRR